MVSEAEIRAPEHESTTLAHRASDAERRRLRWLTFWFYLGVPLTLGFLLGWLQVGRSADWPRSVSLLYWLGVGLLMTPMNALGTAVIAPLLRRLRSPLWLTLFFGQLVAGFALTNPVLQAYRRWLQANIYPDMVLTSAITVGDFLQRLPSNSLLWIGLNLLFFYGLRMPRFGYRPAATTTTTTATTTPVSPRTTRPALMERVRPERRGMLLALEAEGHYLRVHTDAGSDLILYRLSDAMLELADVDGAQVHRSWWVAASALSAERHRDHLQLVNSLQVPVSRSFRVAAQQRGWLS
ncbi:MAG TPA: LytTR family DNA-binding domain-containing protein [Steroidobacteraceae bacterium]|nr:LytTR family DNA-binding domain-containing protein [Steroidobacteraceae bacterium]HRX88887.1 LytTR family DNA-binding domain-containing protein [Steroidobacteraceae bacterium]